MKRSSSTRVWSYDEDLGEFVTDDRFQSRMYLPPEELRYYGEVVVLIGPHCSSACEFFSHAISSRWARRGGRAISDGRPRRRAGTIL